MKAPFVEFFSTLCFFVVIRASLTAETQNVSSSFHQVNPFDLFQTAFFSFGSNSQCSKSSEFRCKDGTCIDLALLCDGIANCADDSDEENCDFIKCRAPNFVKCHNQKCIQANLVCNGHIDCPSGEDEKHCEMVPVNHNCLNTTYKCANGGCIPLAWVCDGKNDCNDGSDEIFGCTSKRCEKNEFQCKSKSCIPLDFRCDGIDDCGDNSDEENCDHHVLDMTNCTLNSGKYPCQDKLKCIDLSSVCDDRKDCFDGSDEGGLCNKPGNNPCPNCTHECHVTPSEAYCLCHKGYWLDEHNICQDINECETYGICDQKCINSPGSYSCACDPAYILQQDKKTCLVPSEHLAVLLYTSSAGVNGLFLHNLRNFTVKETLGPSIGISAANRDIYWTVLTEESQAIVKTSIDDYIPRMIATSGLGSPEDLDVDWITNNVYFTDSKFKHIGVCTNTGRVCTVLFNENIDKPRAISLSPENGLLFWSDWGKWPMIARSGMDGSNGEAFVTKNIHWPNGISTDTPNSRLYWVDAKLQRIESIKFDGTDRRVILSDSVKHPFSISVFENKLYWSNFDGNEILECNKFTGKEKRSLIRDLSNHLYSIHVHHPVHDTQKIENPCAHSECSDMCLLAPPSKNKHLSYSCACPDDKILSNNMKSCSSMKYPKIFIAGLKNRIFLIEHQHLGHPEIKEIPLDINTISSMTYNSLKGEIIVVDSKSASIKSYNLQSKQTTVISQEKIDHVPSIHFDDFGNNLYWCDWETLTIMLMSLKTFARTVVFQGTDYEFPIDLALVSEEGYMFVALHIVSSFNVVIDTIAMDESLISRKRLIEISVGGANVRLYFDRERKRLFWTDLTRGVIESVDLSGEDRITHVKITEPFSSIYFDNMLFWTKKNSPNIFWQDITAVSSHQKHLKLPISEMKREDGVFLINPHNYRVKDSPCHLNNGGCSHICLATNKSSTTECACATGYILSVDGMHCQLPRNCERNEFRCFTGECIPFYKVCDKHRDCLHGDDEFVESCRYFVCPDEQFFCSEEKRCIDKKLKCDGHADCKDGSDEICEPCGKGKFKCDSGECIDAQFRCDGRVDCKHGYDEINCHNVTCGEREFKCKSGQCIPAAWYCDGQFDCVDGSDEHENCAFKCRRGEFHCTNGACVDIYLTCDGKDDCGDGSDEDKECANNKNVYREDIFYYHKNHTGHVYKVCNSRTEFHCETTSGSHCIPKALRCDGVTNCLHGEDEKNCDKVLECAHDNEFYCKTSGKCIPSEWVCDHHNDCGDNSDEDILQCFKKNITGTECYGFRCKNADCISLADVCNNIPDCADQSDEGGQCGNNCEKFGCSHKCHELPTGPKCSCHQGFMLGSDNKTCHDVDECQFDICSQNCTNIPGSFVCSCFSSEYSLRSDHVSCKANGDTAHFIIASLAEINIISNNWMRTSHLVNLPFGSMINAMDVDNRKSHIYTVWDFSSIRKIDVVKSENLILNVPSVYGIAVDWITGNLYYNHDRTSINLVSFSKTVPAVIYDTYGRGQILSLAVDPVAGYLFWYETFGSGNNLDSGVIKRAECDGANVRNITLRMKIVVENIQVDSYERKLYWYSKDMGVVVRMNYDGTSIKEVLHFEKNVAGFSFFENSIYWASENSDIYPIRKCKIYGLPPLKCEVIESRLKGVVYFTVMQESHQRNISNPCSPNPCSDFCVPSPSGPKCLCHHEENQKSISCHLQKAVKLSQSNTSFKTYCAYFVVVCLIVGVGFVGYYYYKPKSRIFHRFHFYSSPFDRSEKLYTSHASGINELVISKPENAFLEPVTEESENEYVMIGHKTSRESLIKNNF